MDLGFFKLFAMIASCSWLVFWCDNTHRTAGGPVSTGCAYWASVGIHLNPRMQGCPAKYCTEDNQYYVSELFVVLRVWLIDS